MSDDSNLRLMIVELASVNPMDAQGSNDDLFCFFCSADIYAAHAQSCLWLRAKVFAAEFQRGKG
jgi:hypothetical protein